MTFFKSPFARLSHKSTPAVATNMSLDSWCHQLHTPPTRFVQKVELCTALAAGEDAWGTPIGKTHHHTLLRVSLAPIPGGPNATGDTFLIERVLSTDGAYHSVTPVAETFSAGGTLFHPDVHDRICVIYDGSSTTLARHIRVERTLAFSNGSSGLHLTLAQFALIVGLVSRTTMLACAGGDCKFQSRTFAFICLAALAPTLPPPTLVSKAGVSVDDSVFELTAEAFLGQVPWLVDDPASVQALDLIGTLKDGPRMSAPARLFH